MNFIDIFKDKSALVVENQSLKQQVEELSPLKAKLNEHETLIAGFPTITAEYNANLDKLKKEHQAEVEKLKADLAEKNNVALSIPVQVSEGIKQQLSNIGIQEGLIQVTTGTDTVYSQWKNMPEATSHERQSKQAFFAKNAAEINKEATNRK